MDGVRIYTEADMQARLAEQRQMCADAVRTEFRALGFPLEPLVINACLNATGEANDEKS